MSDFDSRLAELQAKHGDDAEVYPLEAAGVRVICRTPSEAEMDRFESEMEKEKGKRPIHAVKKIFRQCCLYPEAAELASIIKKKPGLPLTFGQAVLTHAGYLEQELVGKASDS